MLIRYALVVSIVSFVGIRIRLHSSFIQTKMLLLVTFIKPMNEISIHSSILQLRNNDWELTRTD